MRWSTVSSAELHKWQSGKWSRSKKFALITLVVKTFSWAANIKHSVSLVNLAYCSQCHCHLESRPQNKTDHARPFLAKQTSTWQSSIWALKSWAGAPQQKTNTEIKPAKVMVLLTCSNSIPSYYTLSVLHQKQLFLQGSCKHRACQCHYSYLMLDAKLKVFLFEHPVCTCLLESTWYYYYYYHALQWIWMCVGKICFHKPSKLPDFVFSLIKKCSSVYGDSIQC